MWDPLNPLQKNTLRGLYKAGEKDTPPCPSKINHLQIAAPALDGTNTHSQRGGNGADTLALGAHEAR